MSQTNNDPLAPPPSWRRLSELKLLHLQEEWRQSLGCEAPADLGRRQLTRILSYQSQAAVHGDLEPEFTRELAAWAEPRGGKRRKADAVAPGTRIVRVWRGEIYEVTAREHGFEFRGEVYRSLTRVAKVITGTHWNGPMFFGLRGRTPAYAAPAPDRR